MNIKFLFKNNIKNQYNYLIIPARIELPLIFEDLCRYYSDPKLQFKKLKYIKEITERYITGCECMKYSYSYTFNFKKFSNITPALNKIISIYNDFIKEIKKDDKIKFIIIINENHKIHENDILNITKLGIVLEVTDNDNRTINKLIDLYDFYYKKPYNTKNKDLFNLSLYRQKVI